MSKREKPQLLFLRAIFIGFNQTIKPDKKRRLPGGRSKEAIIPTWWEVALLKSGNGNYRGTCWWRAFTRSLLFHIGKIIFFPAFVEK